MIGGRIPDQTKKSGYVTCLEGHNSVYRFYIEDAYGDGICCDWGTGNFTIK